MKDRPSYAEIAKRYDNGSYTFEDAFEHLAERGMAPAVVNDDNGYWAVSASGFCDVQMEPSDWSGSHFVEKAYWKTSLKEAISFFLNGLAQRNRK